MGAISALKNTPETLRSNPVIFAGVFALIVVGAISSVAQTLSTVGILVFGVVFFLVTPFFTAGVIGLIDRSLTADATLSTIFAKGREYYVTLLGATILQRVLFGILGAIIGLGGAFAGIFALSGVGPIGAGVVIAALVLLLFILPLFFLQFFDLAVVVSDTGAVGAFKYSYSVVRQNISSVLGFSILFNLIGAVVAIPGNWLLFGTPTTVEGLQNALVQTSGSIPSDGILSYVVFLVIVGTIVRAVTLTYRVKFYTSTTKEQNQI
ncbi:DUF7847 domain-containing protein [Halococcus qingdaonensis]|uniref:DUF7847 domain-containing protein n=1 Tax=Halococcus qingdaonensis TaxID=224402 RepID=UPI00211604F5|nr:hypothetical protein [Halococcus qingdaonensis]